MSSYTVNSEKIQCNRCYTNLRAKLAQRDEDKKPLTAEKLQGVLDSWEQEEKDAELGRMVREYFKETEYLCIAQTGNAEVTLYTEPSPGDDNSEIITSGVDITDAMKWALAGIEDDLDDIGCAHE